MLNKIIADTISVILEDNKTMLELGSDILSDNLSYNILSAETFRAFERIILEHHSKRLPLKYAFIDYDLGPETAESNVTGVNAIKFIKNFYPECIIIAMSADPESNQKLINAGANKAFAKDYFKAIEWIEQKEISEWTFDGERDIF